LFEDTAGIAAGRRLFSARRQALRSRSRRLHAHHDRPHTRASPRSSWRASRTPCCYTAVTFEPFAGIAPHAVGLHAMQYPPQGDVSRGANGMDERKEQRLVRT
jgi:hypothetical protein